MSQETAPKPELSTTSSGLKPTNFRWVICGLLFYATTINYVDRSILNSLESTLKDQIKWNDFEYGLIGAAFSLAYAIGFLLMGRLMELVGIRWGYAVAVVFWTLSALSTVLTSTPFQFGMSRFFLGLFEAGNFPAAIKTVAEWFPQKQRATATGIFNAGSNIGAIIAPILAVLLVPLWGWKAAFMVTPALAVIWVLCWVALYRKPTEHRMANEAERALIASDAPAGAVNDQPVRWRHLLPHRQAWAFMAGKFLTDPVWWFYLFWAGKFFAEQFKVELKGLAGPLILVYVLADVGSIGGGWFSSWLMKKGWTTNAARKTTMGICACLVLPVIFAPQLPTNWGSGSGNIGMWIAATLIGIAAGAHQGFSANIFTLTSDMFPKRAVASIVALGGLAGAFGGIIMQSVSGVIKEVTQSYLIMFIIAGTAYVLAFIVLHALAPRTERVNEATLESKTLPWPAAAVLWGLLGAVIGIPLSYLFQQHGHDFTTSFPNYLASIVKGWIFILPEYAKRANGSTSEALMQVRAGLLVPLAWTPLAAAGGMALLGAVLHGVILKSPKNRGT